MDDQSNGIFDIDISKLSFKKTREKLSEHHNNYVIFCETGRPKIKLNGVFLPFGPEYFNKKQILNIELSPTKSNVHNNLCSLLSALENDFKNKAICHNQLSKDIEGLTYHSFLKTNKKNILMRTYMSTNPDIYAMIAGFKENVTQSNLKGAHCNIELELGTLWMNDKNFGIIWYVKDVHII